MKVIAGSKKVKRPRYLHCGYISAAWYVPSKCPHCGKPAKR